MSYKDISLIKPIEINRLVSVHYLEYSGSFSFSGEMHNFWEVIYADKSDIIITAGSREMVLRSGNFFIHRPMEFHGVRCMNGVSANAMVFSFYCDSSKLYTIAGRILECSPECRKYLSAIIKEAKSAFSTPLGDPYTAEIVRAKEQSFAAEQIISINIELFLISALRKTEKKSFAVSPIIYVSDEITANVCDYLEKHVSDNLSFSDACKHFSISASKMKQLFRDYVGMGVMEYYMLCKIDCAKHLIREKEKNMSEIAEYLCFSSLQYFSRRFKEITGMTPSEYMVSVAE